jgi:predicted ArsR family transcriptional regulator
MILGKLSWKILTMLSEEEMYPLEIARKLGIHEQLVYYYIRRMVKAGVITVEKEENKKGAIAKYYRAVAPAFGVEFANGYKTVQKLSLVGASEQIQNFFKEFLDENGMFEGKIVVGSPMAHGPSRRVQEMATMLLTWLSSWDSL